MGSTETRALEGTSRSSAQAQDLFPRSDASDEARALVVEHHYSGKWPNAPVFVVTWHAAGGIFGDRGEALAAAVFNRAGVWKESTLELARLVRVPDCRRPLTALLALALREIRRQKLDSLVVSYADPAAGHHGGIYQAASWSYGGEGATGESVWIVDGVEFNRRSIQDRFGTSSVEKVKARLGSRLQFRKCDPKLLYWKALNRAGRAKADRLGLQSYPYPKPSTRAAGE